MKIKTSELNGSALDWAVAESVGLYVYLADKWSVNGKTVQKLKINELAYWNPSTNWSQCGPLIEMYQIEFRYISDEIVRAVLANGAAFVPVPFGTGSDHRIAACRAIVANQLGEEVDVPDDLCLA